MNLPTDAPYRMTLQACRCRHEIKLGSERIIAVRANCKLCNGDGFVTSNWKRVKPNARRKR